MPVTITSQNLAIEGLGSIVVTDLVELDDETFVRAVRFFGPSSGPGGVAPLLLEVKASADSKAAITIATPPAGF